MLNCDDKFYICKSPYFELLNIHIDLSIFKLNISCKSFKFNKVYVFKLERMKLPPPLPPPPHHVTELLPQKECADANLGFL